MIEEYLAKKVIDLAFTGAGRFLKKSDSRLTVSRDDFEKSLKHHITAVRSWCSEISFFELKRAKNTAAVYTPLEVLLYPRRLRIDEAEEPATIPLADVFADLAAGNFPVERQTSRESTKPEEEQNILRHVAILGQPGAGKTTSMKYLCQMILQDSAFMSGRFRLPILIRLRDVSSRGRMNVPDARDGDSVLFDRLQEILGLRIGYPPELEGNAGATQRSAIRERLIIEVLESVQPLVVLDGFDEVVLKKDRDAVIAELRRLAQQLRAATMVLTSRTGEFNYHIEGVKQFEIASLSRKQVRSFVYRWLGDPRAADRLLLELERSPYADTAIRPLTIAQLCAIYERTGRIPEKPKTVYRKIVSLLLEEWDEQRSVRRTSSYAGFEVDRKFEFLSHLAFILTTLRKGTVFSKADLADAYTRIHQNYGLPRGEADKVADELESCTGLFVRAGYELFEFSHKSLQEYLTSEYIVRLPSIPDGPQLLARLPNELAIAIAISSNPSQYLEEIVFSRLVGNTRLRLQFFTAFVSRMLTEKPDFHMSNRVGAALVALYSIYLRAVVGESAQQQLFVSDSLATQFDSLAAMIRTRLTMRVIKREYEVVERTQATDAVPILRMTRKKLSRSAGPVEDSESLRRLPKEILVRATLVEA
jgi:hypothetical protein